MEYATRNLYFPYTRTHEPLGEYVYEENSSDRWHVPRYPTRKHCIYNYFISCLNLRQIYRNFRKSSEMAQNGFKIFGKSSEVFGKLWKWFKSVFQMIL